MNGRPSPRAARLAADQARQQMRDTLATLKARVEPAQLRADATQLFRSQAENAGRAGLGMARRHPVIVAAAAVAMVAAFARKPLVRFIRMRRERSGATIVRTPVNTSVHHDAQDSVKGTEQ